MFSGYVFWFIISKFATAATVGTSSAVISMVTIFINIATIGIPIGVERFLGKSFSEKKLGNARLFVEASTVLVSFGTLACCIAILIFRNLIQNVFKIDPSLMVVAILLICSSCIYNLFRSVIISSLKTKSLPLIMIISTGAKIVLSIVLVLMGMGAFGITLGYALFSILGSILFIIVVIMIFKGSKNNADLKLKQSFKNILEASMTNWIPALIATLGSQLGTIVVFASNGASQAGVYFISYSIVTAIAAVASVLFTIAFPALSAMDDGRKTFVWRIIKMSAIISIPFSASAFFYSKEIMQLFGQSYADGSLLLQIMVLATLPGQIASGVSTLTYSYGKYRQALSIGITGNVARIILFFILVPMYGSSGAALSYTLSTITSLIMSMYISRKIGLHIFWKIIVLTHIVPFVLAFVLSYFQVNFIIGTFITLVSSYLLLLRLHIITRSDIQDSVGVLPGSIANSTLNLLNKIGKKLDSSY
ncbi:MAG TPA: oligosaccharide flippase family protein [Nitrosopumilaceae archaeon]|nr:oligosaccharide flippase family protein [Nitrosopumilaceae archaeon]